MSSNSTSEKQQKRKDRERLEEKKKKKMGVMDRLKVFAIQEPVVVASCLIAGFGLFLPAVVRPMLDSFDSAKQVPQPALSDVVAGVTGKNPKRE